MVVIGYNINVNIMGSINSVINHREFIDKDFSLRVLTVIFS